MPKIWLIGDTTTCDTSNRPIGGPFSLTYAGGYAKKLGLLVTLLLLIIQFLKQDNHRNSGSCHHPCGGLCSSSAMGSLCSFFGPSCDAPTTFTNARWQWWRHLPPASWRQEEILPWTPLVGLFIKLCRRLCQKFLVNLQQFYLCDTSNFKPKDNHIEGHSCHHPWRPVPPLQWDLWAFFIITYAGGITTVAMDPSDGLFY